MEFDNIVSGYRAPCDDVRAALASMLPPHLHNETLNAWTMVLGAGVLLALNLGAPQRSQLQVLHLATILLHLPFSFMYHTLSCSPKYGRWARALDVGGILLVGALLSVVTGGHVFGLDSARTWALVTAALAIFCAHLHSVLGGWDGGSPGGSPGSGSRMCAVGRLHTTLLVGMSVMCYNVPLLHVLASRDSEYTASARVWSAIEFAAVLLAAALYVTGFPEALFKKTFDLVGSSHQLAHLVLIVQQVALWRLLSEPVRMGDRIPHGPQTNKPTRVGPERL